MWWPAARNRSGLVKTGVAVKAGSRHPKIGNREELAAAFRAANGIYHPDPDKATAGIHFMNVLKALGLDQELKAKLRPYPNGATAMGEMAKSERAEPDRLHAGDRDQLHARRRTGRLAAQGVRAGDRLHAGHLHEGPAARAGAQARGVAGGDGVGGRSTQGWVRVLRRRPPQLAMMPLHDSMKASAACTSRSHSAAPMGSERLIIPRRASHTPWPSI